MINWDTETLVKSPEIQMILGSIHKEETRIKNIILKCLKKENLPSKEFQLRRDRIVNQLPLDWPLLPLSKGIFPKEIADYIRYISEEYCLDDKGFLWHFWVSDVLTHLKKLSQIVSENKNIGITLEDVDNARINFAAHSLALLIFVRQTNLENGSEDKLNFSLDKCCNLHTKIELLSDEIKSLKAKVLHASQTAKKQARTIQSPILKKQFIAIHTNAGLVEKELSEVANGLDNGLTISTHPYYRQYFYGIEIGDFVPEVKAKVIKYNQENIEKINTLIYAIQNGWQKNREDNLVGMNAGFMESLCFLPKLESFDKSSVEEITFYTTVIRRGIGAMHSQYDHITKLYYQSLQNEFSWAELKSELNKSGRFLINDHREDDCLGSTNEWFSEVISCFCTAYDQLMTINRMYENVICHNKIAQFTSNDELSNRLAQNFKNIFTENLENSCNISKRQIEPENQLDLLIESFSSDLSEINKQFGAKINDHLPDRKIINLCIFHFTLLNNAMLSQHLLLPFRPAVIFAASCILPAIKKAHTWLFKRFEVVLKGIDSRKLANEREFLIERLQGLSFIKMKPLLELLITIRDIQAILLEPEECSQEMKDGFHLIPTEFVNLLQPTQISELIDMYIEKGIIIEDSIRVEVMEDYSEEMVLILQDLKDFEGDVIPALQNSMNNVKASKILGTLSDSRSFKIAKGEKTIKILKRLRELGAYKLRSGKGSHSIWAHPNTYETFSFVNGEDLSPGVAKKLEDWVNGDIFKNM